VNEVEWDDVKDADNLAKRGLPLRYGALLFDGPFVEEEDARKDYGESARSRNLPTVSSS
jgi:uncharacterized protein